MPDGFDIPIPFLNTSFHVYFYGILITIGVIAATLLALAQAKRRGQNPDLLWDMLFWVVIAGIVGARIWHVLTPPPSMVAQGITTQYYLTHPLDMIDIRKGGLGIPGAVIGGVLAMWVYTRRKKLSLITWLDITAPGLALAQAIGRWGNFFNQELYGAPTNLPWKIYIDPAHRLPGFENFAYYQPLFLYESLWDLANMADPALAVAPFFGPAEDRGCLPGLPGHLSGRTIPAGFHSPGCITRGRDQCQPDPGGDRGRGGFRRADLAAPPISFRENDR